MSPDKICIIPRATGIGGPAAFTSRLTAALQAHGVAFTHDMAESGITAVLVVGGSRHLYGIWQAKRRGARIVQRLNGMNWVHRQAATGLRHFLRAEVNNRILATIRSRLADRIIYQSHFTQDWWMRVYSGVKAPGRVIYNGVDLQAFTPQGESSLPTDHFRILAVEGRYSAGYEIGLDNAAALSTRSTGTSPPQSGN
jgi:glycosyltransferase involved in cell wall biosynthesis